MRNNKKTRIGQTAKNKNGQMMTIIAYRHCKDIDVEFEDGTIVQHQRMESFTARKIVNPNYKTAYDISMNEFIMSFYFKQIGFEKFECGSLKNYGLENYSLDLFNPKMMIGIEYDGKIHEFNNERDDRKDILCTNNSIRLIRIRERLAETAHAKCYLLATPSHFSKKYEAILKEIAEYLHNAFNLPLVDINFKRDKSSIFEMYEQKHVMPRIGEEYTSIRGEHAKIVKYFSSVEVFIEFDDGFVKKYSIHALKQGRFYRYPQAHYKTLSQNTLSQNIKVRETKIIQVGETKIMSNGMEATLIAYRNYDDCDFEFEDGAVVTHKSYQTFAALKLGNPNIWHQNKKALDAHVGETAMMKNGQKATIIAYRSYTDIDVELDDGTILTNQRYERFQKKQMSSPQQKPKPVNFNSRIGEVKMMKCGQEATIVGYRSVQDIDVKFEDGTIVCNKAYNSFKKGQIGHPECRTIVDQRRTDYVGESKTMNCGMMATIIAARSSKDIDIQFADGTIVEHKRHDKFTRGKIAHPNIPLVTYSKMNKKNHVGESQIMNCGMLATIIVYRKNTDVDVRFADGTIVENRRYSYFKNGSIANPNIRKNPNQQKGE